MSVENCAKAIQLSLVLYKMLLYYQIYINIKKEKERTNERAEHLDQRFYTFRLKW